MNEGEGVKGRGEKEAVREITSKEERQRCIVECEREQE
mgnify:CR=1 FL=1|tara:strand:- start:349 stop:462 length:114 start_codon:yes stop_codon:yes gene_type:complete